MAADLHSTLINYDSLSIPTLSLLLLLHFLFLTKTAAAHFSPSVSLLADRLSLSPSMAAVTLLSLANGAPDLFSSFAAVNGGETRTGLASILSAGAFVSSLVLGLVSINSSPFSVDPSSFVRDAFFYIVSSSALFCVYLSGEVYLWQAVGFVLFYVFFVWVVFRMDSVEKGMKDDALIPVSVGSDADGSDSDQSDGVLGLIQKIALAWNAPTSTILKLTIPSPRPAEWTRLHAAAHVAFCPPTLLVLALRHAFPQRHRPAALLVSTVVPLPFASAIYFFPQNISPPLWNVPPTLLAFTMAAVWISATAAELVSCLAALGRAVGLPPSVLGLTFLAWGNSAGDLVGEIAVARGGRPAMAVAGCFAGPMFNMLVGLGSGLAAAAADVYPGPFQLTFHVSIAVAFGFLLLSLMGSLLVVTWCRFRVPRVWGFCLVILYSIFTAVCIAVAMLLP